MRDDRLSQYRKRIRVWLAGAVTALTLLVTTGNIRRVEAQELFEFEPYRMQLWLALGPGGKLSPRFRERLEGYILEQSELVAFATWDLKIGRPPADLATDATQNMDLIDLERLKEHHAGILKLDKLILLTVTEHSSGFHLQSRQLDCQTRIFSDTLHVDVRQPSQLASSCFSAITKLFAPLTRVEETKGREAIVRARAGGLAVHGYNPAAVNKGDVLLPVIRKNDRYGEPKLIQIPPYTFLSAIGREKRNIKCTIQTGLRTPLGTKSSSRRKRLALVAKPTTETTRLICKTNNKDKPILLVGYDIYSKDPMTEEVELLGQSDWRGSINIKQDGKKIRLIYVRSGGNLLARLPMVPGFYQELTSEMRDDRVRLQEEGFVKSLQSRLTDLVARRALLNARFHQRVKGGKLDEASKALDEYRKLTTMRQINQMMRSRTTGTSHDELTQRKIDRMYKDTGEVMAKFLSDTPEKTMSKALQIAQNGGVDPDLVVEDPDDPDSTPESSSGFPLAEARANHETKLTQNNSNGLAAPQPPAGVLSLVKYDAPIGPCAAYLTPNPGDGQKHPAIIWLLSGHDNSIDDRAWKKQPATKDESASAFRDAGIVTMYPSTRGGNDNPGTIERFYREVDDIISAHDYLANLDYVDPSRIYLGGHTTGGTLALLCAASTDRFRAIFALGPADEVASYRIKHPFDLDDPKESSLRSPMDHLDSIKTPVFVLEGETGLLTNIDAMKNLQDRTTNPLVKFYPVTGKNMFSVIAPATKLLARKITEDSGGSVNITIDNSELAFP